MARKRQTETTQVLDRVSVGESVTVTRINQAGDVVRCTPMTFTVGEKCSGHSAHAGQWICATHGMRFSNQFCKDTHIHTGAHRLAWFCAECNNAQVP